jgi:signal transduction histidine kinase
MRLGRLPRLRSLLLLLALILLVLPLTGLWFLRLYQSALIRQTQAELIAQASVVAGAYAVERNHLLAGGAEQEPPSSDQAPVANVPDLVTHGRSLDLSIDPVLPPPPDPQIGASTASELARKAGQSLMPVLADTKQVTLAALRIVDRSGVIVATTGDDLGRVLTGWSEVDRALAGKPVSVMRWRQTQVKPGGINRESPLRVFVALPIADGDRIVGAVVASRTPYSLVQTITGKWSDLLAVGLLLVGVGATLALILSRVVTRPIGRLVTEAERVASGASARPGALHNYGTREVAQLSVAVARMAETLDRRADYIRSFAANVLHEFKTPLAGAKGAAELLADHGATMSTERREHFLGVIQSSVDRLDLLVRRLVEFARADVMRPVADRPIPLKPVLEALAAEFRCKGIRVEIAAGKVAVRLAEEAIETIFANLLSNVQQHAGSGAAVVIAATEGPNGVVISVSDDGPGITEGNASRIFDPFFTTRRDRGGTGLGLAIVSSILASVGGTISLVGSGPGARFVIRLPSPAG